MALAPPPVESDHTARAALLDAIRVRPGSTVADLARATLLSHTTATYHLRRLEKRRAVVPYRRRGRLHYFLNGQATPDERARVVGSRLTRADLVLARVPPDRPVALGEVATGLPMTKAGVVWHLERLVSLGLIVAEGAPGFRGYRRAAAH